MNLLVFCFNWQTFHPLNVHAVWWHPWNLDFSKDVDFTELSKVLFDYNTSTMDTITMSAIAILMMVVSIAIYIGNFTLKDQFIELLESFQSQHIPQNKNIFKREPRIQNLKRNFFLILLIFSWYFIVIGSSIPGYFDASSGIRIDLNAKSIIFITMFVMILIAIQSSPIVGFVILYR